MSTIRFKIIRSKGGLMTLSERLNEWRYRLAVDWSHQVSGSKYRTLSIIKRGSC